MGNLKKLIDLTLLRTYTNIVKGLIGTRASQSDLTTHTSDSTVHVTSAEKQTWNGKQDSLTFDEVPTANSNNPVKSGGIWRVLSNVFNRTIERLTFGVYNAEDDEDHIAGYITASETELKITRGYDKDLVIGDTTNLSRGKVMIKNGNDIDIFGDGARLTLNSGETRLQGSDIYISAALGVSITSSDGCHVTINGNDIDELFTKIPADASSGNQLADKVYVKKKVSEMDTLTPVVKNRLPNASEKTMKMLYLIPSEAPESLNTMDEYITVKQKVGWWLEDVIGELFEKGIPNPTGDNIAYGTTDDIPLDLIEQAAIDVGALVLNKEESIEWDGELESAAWDRAIAFYDEDTGGIGFMRAEVGTVYESESDGLNYILTSQGWVDVDSILDNGEEHPALRDAYSYSWEKIGSTAMSVDSEPTEGSDNLVTSGGIYAVVSALQARIKTLEDMIYTP